MAGVSTKEIKNRIRSMESTKQITKAMEMVAASKLRRAKERVLYDSYIAMIGAGSMASQRLLFPERLTLTEDDYALLVEQEVEFTALGFDISFIGDFMNKDFSEKYKNLDLTLIFYCAPHDIKKDIERQKKARYIAQSKAMKGE